jgi:hypothetical protein
VWHSAVGLDETTWSFPHAMLDWGILLSLYWVGAGLAVVRRLERRTILVLLAALLVTWLQLSGALRTARFLGIAADPRNWLPLPVVVAALVRTAFPARFERWAWPAAGALHGLWVLAVWPPQQNGAALPGLILAAAGMLGGAALGARVAGLMERPNRRTLALVPTLGVALPAVLGLVDLRLRVLTP